MNFDERQQRAREAQKKFKENNREKLRLKAAERYKTIKLEPILATSSVSKEKTIQRGRVKKEPVEKEIAIKAEAPPESFKGLYMLPMEHIEMRSLLADETITRYKL